MARVCGVVNIPVRLFETYIRRNTQLFAIGRNKQPGQIIGSPPKATGKGPTYLLYGRLGKRCADIDEYLLRLFCDGHSNKKQH